MKRIIVSGGFDPVHIGHIRMFEHAEQLGDAVIVILNTDEFLVKKKGASFYPDIYEREQVLKWGMGIRFGRPAEIVYSIDKDMTVCETLKMVREIYAHDELVFANGGDRDGSSNTPEHKVCESLKIKMVYGVGGYDKPQSSSWLIENAKAKV